MVHDDSKDNPESGTLCALLWRTYINLESKNEDPLSEYNGKQPWKRIPNTPYIAPQGEQSISILRYFRNEDSTLNFEKPLYYGRTPQEMYHDFQRLGIIKSGHWMYTNRHDLISINMRIAFRYSFLELGPLYSWLKEQFQYFFSRDKNGHHRAQLLIYPSHPVTDSMIEQIKKDSSFNDILPSGGLIPVKFLRQRTVSPLLASHLVKHRIKELVKRNKWKKWVAVIFDDGTVTGKHLRELSQLIQSLGARYYSIALLDRSGLPAQEELLEKFNRQHKRFWRWDVPGLGNKRNCPLCQAVAIVQTFGQKISSERKKTRLKEWIRNWKVRDVDLSWHIDYLPQKQITPPLEITFGVDLNNKNIRKEKKIAFADSSLAASLLTELTRLTTRADVTIKKADKIKAIHPDAAIEFIAIQLLLFFDELSVQEKIIRYKKLLDYIWERDDENEATSLAGLCFALIDENIISEVWEICKKVLIPKKLIGNLDATLVTNLIQQKFEFDNINTRNIDKSITKVERLNWTILGVSIGFMDAISNFLYHLYRHPSNDSQLSAHSTEIRERLNTFTENEPHDQKLKVSATEVVKDLKLIKKIFNDLHQNWLISKQNIKLDDLNNNIDVIEKKFKKKSNEWILKKVQKLREKLLGNSQNGGYIDDVGKALFRQYHSSDAFDNDFMAISVRELRRKWEDIILSKEENEKYYVASSRWRGDKRKILKPIITCSPNDALQNIWVFSDSFTRGLISDMLSNVFHANKKIKDPFNKNNEITHVAHIWWYIEKNENHAILTMANSTGNMKISLRQNANLAGFEHAGGSTKTTFKKIGEDLVAFMEIHLPLHSFYIKEQICYIK